MKKRIMSLALCLVMLLTTFAFTSCDEGNFITDPPGATQDPMTIHIYGITDDSTTEAAILRVEEALTEIAVNKYNTTIDLHLFPEREYAAILFNKTQTAMNTYVTQRQNDTNLSEEEKNLIKTVDFSKVDGVRVATQIPSDVTGASLDIFLVYNPPADSETLNPDSEYYNPAIANNGMLNVLYNAMALAPLKSSIDSGTFSTLKSNAYAEALSYLELATYQTMNNPTNRVLDYYGIPNNYVYGSYEYILFNKTYVDPLFSAEDKSDLAQPQIEQELPNGSIQVVDCPALRGLKAELSVMQENGELEGVEIERTFSSYEEFSQYIRGGNQVAIAIINGDKAVEQLASESGIFDVYVRSVSELLPIDLCQSMFCISNTVNATPDKLSRCLQILTLINTDSEFRNILQYGVENVHYTEGRDGTVYLTGTEGDRYIMNPMYTGNMFILKPCDTMTESEKLLAADNWLLGKLQTNEVLEAYNNA